MPSHARVNGSDSHAAGRARQRLKLGAIGYVHARHGIDTDADLVRERDSTTAGGVAVMDGPSTSTIFGVSFFGALFAIVASLLLVYTYVTLRLIPKIKRSFRELVEEIGPKALFARANLDPAEVMQQLGVSPTDPKATDGAAGAVRIVFTCEDHGRCIGCLKVLAQFEAIIRHQGEASFDEVERTCYAHLRGQLADDAALDGESETERQKRIAGRVVESLVREGFAASRARGVVWVIGKDDRATFGSWLSAARACCEKLVEQDDQEKVA